MRMAPGTETAGAATTSRRRFIRGALLTSLGLAGAGAVAGLVDYLFPRHVWYRAYFRAGNVRDYPAGGAPVHFAGERPAEQVFRDGRGIGGFWLVHLDPGDRQPNGSGGESGFIALAEHCTHLGCAVPWRPEFRFEGTPGWFRCPCHGATFTRAGLRVYGPAPRGLDTYRVQIATDGTVRVDRTSVVRASGAKPAPAVPVPEHLRPAE